MRFTLPKIAIHAYCESVPIRSWKSHAPISAGLAVAVTLTGAFAQTSATAATLPNLDNKVTARVIGGTNAVRSQSPFFLQLDLVSPPGGGSLCGATAISRRWAVTAAHCVNGAAGKILIGRGKTAILVNPARRGVGKRYYLERAFTHPNWRANSSNQLSDVALLKTMRPMPVRPLRLNVRKDLPALNSAERVYGFGERVLDVPSSIPTFLQQADVTDLAGPYSTTCGKYGSSYNRISQLCSGRVAGGVDACYGDSGGPLVATILGTRRLVGIVSSGIDCADPDYPGLYTRVSTFAHWIQRRMRT